MGKGMRNLTPGIFSILKKLRPVTPGKFIQPGEQPFFGTFADKNLSVTIAQQIDIAVFDLLGRFTGEFPPTPDPFWKGSVPARDRADIADF